MTAFLQRMIERRRTGEKARAVYIKPQATERSF